MSWLVGRYIGCVQFFCASVAERNKTATLNKMGGHGHENLSAYHIDIFARIGKGEKL